MEKVYKKSKEIFMKPDIHQGTQDLLSVTLRPFGEELRDSRAAGPSCPIIGTPPDELRAPMEL
jgi:hypothetical protein